MKDYWAILKDNRKNVMFGLFIILIVIPFLINLLFQISAPIIYLQAEWKAGDVLTLYGALLGGCVTAFGVYISITHTANNYREDMRYQSLPFLTIDREFLLHKQSSLLNKGYYPLTRSIFTIKNAEVSFNRIHCDVVQEEQTISGITCLENYLKEMTTCSSPMEVHIVLQNAGNGVAINVQTGVRLKNDDINVFGPMSLRMGQYHFITIKIVDDATNSREYLLDFVYEDILTNKYQQSFFFITSNDEHGKQTLQIDLNRKQCVIKYNNKQDDNND